MAAVDVSEELKELDTTLGSIESVLDLDEMRTSRWVPCSTESVP